MKISKTLKLLFFIVLLLCNCWNKGYAQRRAVIEWEQSYGGTLNEQARCVISGINGGFVMCGASQSADGDVSANYGLNDGWIISTDGLGKLNWQKSLGGSNNETILSIRQVSSGYILAGYTASTNGDITYNHGGFDAWIIRLSATGSIVWQKTYGGTNNDEAFAIQATRDGGYIFSGFTNSTDGDVSGLHHSATGRDDAWIVKLDDTGKIEWQKCLGGSDEDQAFSIQQTKDSGYIVCGVTASTDGDVSGLHDSTDVWVLKLDVSGTIKWQRCLGGSRNETGFNAAQTADGGYIVGAGTSSTDGDVTYNHGNGDYWMIKLNADGSTAWQKTYGGGDNDLLFSLIQTIDGGYIMTGGTLSSDGDVSGFHPSHVAGQDEWVVRTDGSGKIVWQRCLGGSSADAGYSIIQVADSEYAAVAEAASVDGDVTGNHGSGFTYDYWLVKLRETDTTTGVPLISTTVITQIYPTITSGLVYVTLPNGSNTAQLQLFDINGKKLDVKVGGSGNNRTIEIPPNTTAGELVLRVYTNNKIESKKIIYKP